jgi:hypothetical protein
VLSVADLRLWQRSSVRLVASGVLRGSFDSQAIGVVLDEEEIMNTSFIEVKLMFRGPRVETNFNLFSSQTFNRPFATSPTSGPTLASGQSSAQFDFRSIRLAVKHCWNWAL